MPLIIVPFIYFKLLTYFKLAACIASNNRSAVKISGSIMGVSSRGENRMSNGIPNLPFMARNSAISSLGLVQSA
jgi:hypothetical protein